MKYVHKDFSQLLNINEDIYIGSDPCASLCGLLTIALYNYYECQNPKTSIAMDKNYNTESLMYKIPEIKLNSKKARINTN